MYYLVYVPLYLISLLPYRILYFLSDGLYGLAYHVLGYRKKVVMHNLKIAFPEKTELERIKIAKKFYHYLMDNFVEIVKLLSVSEKAFFKRCSGNFDIVNEVAARGKNIQLHSGHQFNSEYGIWYYSKSSVLPVFGMYVRLTSKAMDKLFLNMRESHGIKMIEASDFTKLRLVLKHRYLFGWVADQNPTNPRIAYWLNFFKRPVPFSKAAEKLAIKNNNAVVFARIKKIKRGNYYFENIIVTENAAGFKEGELTKKYRDFLEETIRLDPGNYLWSHRRWKHDFKTEYEKSWIDG
jgi:KDO2-lipid IV(A) lauroyltransferase